MAVISFDTVFLLQRLLSILILTFSVFAISFFLFLTLFCFWFVSDFGPFRFLPLQFSVCFNQILFSFSSFSLSVSFFSLNIFLSLSHGPSKDGAWGGIFYSDEHSSVECLPDLKISILFELTAQSLALFRPQFLLFFLSSSSFLLDIFNFFFFFSFLHFFFFVYLFIFFSLLVSFSLFKNMIPIFLLL